MKRPLTVLFIMYILGIIMGKMEVFFLLIPFSLLGIIIFYWYPKTRRDVVLISLFILIGFFSTYTQMNKISQVKDFHNKRVEINAQVLQPPLEKDDKMELFLRIHHITLGKETYSINENILGKIYKEMENQKMNINAGDILCFQGKIKIPEGIRNPGGFDYNLYLRTKKVLSTVTIYQDTLEKTGYSSPKAIYKGIYNLKNYVKDIIEKNLPIHHGNLLKAILFGEKELDGNIQNSFIDSGIAHVLAVSGLHVGFLIAFVLYFIKLFGCSQRTGLFIISFMLVGYILLTGGSPSVIRASIMAWLFLLSKYIHKHYDGITSISLAGFVILLPNPLLLFTASFQLSFVAALSIILFYPVLSRHFQGIKYVPKVVLDILGITLAVQIGTLPISLYHFYQVSLISIITNLFVIPMLGILFPISILAIGIFIIIPIIGQYLFFLSTFMFQWIIQIAHLFSSFPLSHINLPPLTWKGMLLYLLLCLSLGGYIPLQIRKIRMITLGSMGMIILLLGVGYLTPQPLKVTFLDVQQGDSILIESPYGKSILIDGGGYPSYGEQDRKVSQNVLLPALYAKGIQQLDLVMVSHGHEDHIKGIMELIGEIPIRRLGIYYTDNENVKEVIYLAKENNIDILYLTASQSLQLEKGLTMEILSPPRDMPRGERDKEVNNGSLVIKMNFHRISFLFTGDIEKEMEEQLVQKQKNISSTVLKVAHHGSDTSTSQDFINKVQPKVCVISVGEDNNFGHPSPTVLERLKKMTPYLYRTDKNGAVEIHTNGNWVKVRPYLLITQLLEQSSWLK